MMSFQKPENALKRSEELLEVGRPEDSLEVLRQALLTRRFRFAWSDAMEDIMKSYINLSGSLKRLKGVKDGLQNYRSACQASNMSSFATVVRYYCSYSENLLNEAKSRLPDPNSVLDLDDYESPANLLLTAFGADSSSLEERTAREAMKNLWETYRTALEVTRSHVAVEDVYHEIALKACAFCQTYSRKNEFKRLCDSLRVHYQYLIPKVPRAASTGPVVVSGNSPETISRVLETRTAQMRVAIEMGLWTTAYQVAEDIHGLMQKKRPTQVQLKQYYLSLSKVFWVSTAAQHRFLFHGFMALRHFFVARQLKSYTEAETTREADAVVLAVLASFSDSAVPSSGADATTYESEQQSADRMERMSLLTSSTGGAPVPDQLMAELVNKNVVNLASPLVKKIFEIVSESSGAVSDLNAEMQSLFAQLPADLQGYVPAIRKVVLVRTIKEMCQVFKAVTFDEFKRQTSVVSNFAEVDRIVSHLRKTAAAEVRIDYLTETVSFSKSSAKQTSAHLTLLPPKVLAESISEFQNDLTEATERERETLEQRRVSIKDKQLELERRLREAEESRVKRTREADELAREVMKKRAEEDLKRRENEAREKAKNQREMEKAKELEERLKDDKTRAAVAAAVASKPITAVVRELERQLEQQNKKDKALKLQQRKAEFKRVNLTAKVLRFEEAKHVANEYKPHVNKEDDKLFEELKASKSGEINSRQQNIIEARAILAPVKSILDTWRDSHMVARKEKHEGKLKAAREAFIEKHARAVIERAIIDLDSFGDEDYKEYEELADVIRVESNVSREEFKRS